DGTTWSQPPAPAVNPGGAVVDVWGSSSTDVWGSEFGGMPWATLFHLVGGPGAQQVKDVGPTSVMSALHAWGSGPNDVYFVGTGAILHYDGAGAKQVFTPPGKLLAVWGSGPKDVYAVGEMGLLHYD